ncbi:tricarboxylate transporter [Talaromyces proteolyticus]|uniref:Tricarboxylate transporter n=1 Tax=Talaromyces proteolyticus TaxID=1131652 RepID=A0AAD4KQ17_9EURO|nr:tricarboxylate transporter [Talaromyces proteolyticus]KAH8695633.1 tricarboxylate transporter [Talaromyces proteolyticus]
MSNTPSPTPSVIACCIAGATEIAITYLAEFAKTRSQLNRRLGEGQKLPAIVGNAIKVAIRLVAYERIVSLLKDETGYLTPIQSSLAGLGAGCLESVLAVTPSESIKTILIDNRKSEEPWMRGMVHCASVVVRERGFSSLLQGLVPTTVKQAANSATRFTTYTTIRDMWQKRLPKDQKPDAVAIFAIGAMADTIKTRMQKIDARRAYQNSFDSVVKVVRNEGFSVLSSGAVPRLARLMVSGGVVFTAYEKNVDFLGLIDPQSQWI